MGQNWLGKQLDDYRDFGFDLYGFRHDFDELVSIEANILEIGFGNGYFLERLEKKGYKYLTGIDLSPTAIVEAGGRTKAKLLQMDAHSMDFFVGSFDAIIASHVIEHSPVPKALLDEMIRVCNPNGLLFVEIPIEHGWNMESAHFSYWNDPKDFKSLLESEGLEIIKEQKGYTELDGKQVAGKENHYFVICKVLK